MRLDSNGSSQKITMHFLASLILTAATPGSSFVIAAISSAMRYSFSNEYCGWTSSVTASPEKADIPLSAETMTVPDRRIENMLRKFVKFRFSYIIDCQITRCFEDPCAEVLNIRRRSAIQLYKQLLHDVLCGVPVCRYAADNSEDKAFSYHDTMRKRRPDRRFESEQSIFEAACCSCESSFRLR